MRSDDDCDFDRWVAEQGGAKAVGAMIEDTKHRVADGTLPALQDKEALLAHWDAGRHQSV
jgi:hypothetical protein